MNLPTLVPEWLFWTLIALLVLSALQDAVMLKISNYLSAAVLLLGIVAAVIAGPTLNLWENGVAFILSLAIGTFLFGRGILGGGDVKLFAATVLWFDLGGALRLVVWTALAGGVLAVLIIAMRVMPWPEAIRSRIKVLQPKSGIPYGIAIAAGAIIASMQLMAAARAAG
ncbi:prepilin peptidase [Sphingomonas sp. LHG3406-1]|uniref:A24 family peptidase n=1 Tax=Sphingomonas sp. LHG3406-1 TaxID=2804617 RepID=UPI00262365F9|nr:prepilin peptidase [Sphingomonas sp. LHG3406-1]